MPRTAAASRSLRDRQRANLLEAARRLIARGGPTTMEALAAEAGVSQGLAYRYFRSKEALLIAMIEASMRSASPWNAPLRPPPGTPREQLERIVTHVLERRREHPELYRFFFRALAAGELQGRARALLRRRSAEFEQRIRSLVVAAQRAGEIPPDDPDELVLALIGCLQGIWRGMSRESVRGAPPPLPRAEIVLRLLGRPVAPRGAGRRRRAASAG
jgi:AcrR family transcriptional regulator